MLRCKCTRGNVRRVTRARLPSGLSKQKRFFFGLGGGGEGGDPLGIDPMVKHLLKEVDRIDEMGNIQSKHPAMQALDARQEQVNRIQQQLITPHTALFRMRDKTADATVFTRGDLLCTFFCAQNLISQV